jgi:hypothetical protein
MRTSTESDEKKAYETAALDRDNQDGGSSAQEHAIRKQENGATLDEEQQDDHSIAESQLPPPPDGGLHAWLKVFGGFLIYINIWLVFLCLLSGIEAYSPQGLHALVRRLSVLLLIYATQLILAILHLMDRHSAGMASHCYWCALRSTV